MLLRLHPFFTLLTLKKRNAELISLKKLDFNKHVCSMFLTRLYSKLHNFSYIKRYFPLYQTILPNSVNIRSFSEKVHNLAEWEEILSDQTDIEDKNPNDLMKTLQSFQIPSNLSVSECTNLILQSQSSTESMSYFNSLIKQGGIPDLILYTCFIKSLFLYGDCDLGFKYYNQCLKEFKVDSIFYENILEPLSKQSLESEVSKVYTDCISHGLITTKAMTYYIFTKKDSKIIYEHIKEMENYYQIQPDFLCYSVIFNRGKIKDMDLIYKCIDECIKMNITPLLGSLHFYCKVLTNIDRNTPIFEKFDRCRLLLYIFDFMLKNNYKLSITIYSIVINFCGECGWLKDGNRIFNIMLEKGIIPNIELLTSLISGYCKKKQLKEAMDLYHKLDTFAIKPNEYTFSVLINGCARAGDINLAEEIISDMKRLKFEISSPVYNSLIYLYGRIGKPEKGIEMFNELERQDHLIPRSYSAIIYLCSCNNQFQNAIEYMNKEIENGIQVKNESILCYLEFVIKNSKDIENLKSILNFIKSNKVNLDSDETFSYLHALNKRGDVNITKKIVSFLTTYKLMRCSGRVTKLCEYS